MDSFADQFFIKVLIEKDDEDLIPLVKFEVKISDGCCGGYFYVKPNKLSNIKDQLATSSNYPYNYDKNSKCPYIFKVRYLFKIFNYTRCIISFQKNLYYFNSFMILIILIVL